MATLPVQRGLSRLRHSCKQPPTLPPRMRNCLRTRMPENRGVDPNLKRMVDEKFRLHSKSAFKIAEGANRRRKLVLTPGFIN